MMVYGMKERSFGVGDVPCVMGGKHILITSQVVPGEVPCLLSTGWLRENGAMIDTQARVLKTYETKHHGIVG